MRETETSLIYQGKEEEKEADIFAGKEVWNRADPVLLPLPFSTAAASWRWVAAM